LSHNRCHAVTFACKDSQSVDNAAQLSVQHDGWLDNISAAETSENVTSKIEGRPKRSILDRAHLESVFAEAGVKPLHVGAVYTHLFKRGGDFDSVPDLGEKAKRLLREGFTVATSKVLRAQETENGMGVKLEVQLQDGLRVESVIIRHFHLSTGGGRTTVCVSSQVGCAMGCKFCATGTMGLKRNLTSAEILEQVWHCMQLEPVRNVVFMGMGEPLDNYPAVLHSLSCLTDNQMFALAASRITVSTVGVLPRMRDLAVDFPKANLALSLHAANQGLRESIIPTATRYTLEKLKATLDFYHSQTGKMVMMEYTVIGGVNDSAENAHELGKWCQDFECMVNLIPYNSTDVGTLQGYRVPTDEAVKMFEQIVKKYELRVMVRWSSAGGREVDGACGQMVLK